MKNSELVEHIESNYDVKSIQYKKLNLWLEIRNRLFPLINIGQESTLKVNTSTYKTVLLSSFYGFFNWFKSYDCWIFSAKINRVKIDEKYHDRLYEYIGVKFKKSLFIEVTTDEHFKRREVASKNMVSKSALILVEKLVGAFINIRKINQSVIREIEKEFQIKFDANYSLKKMISQYKTMRFILRFKRPKVVFLSPAYTAYGYISAFKEKGIKVIEVQHGVILKEHFGYYHHHNFNQESKLDYLLTFGENEIKVFEDNYYIDKAKVIPVGNYYLDHIQQNYKPNQKIEKLVQKFQKSFVVSLQDIDQSHQFILALIECAKRNPNSLFILKPRMAKATDLIHKYGGYDNLVFEDKINIYQLILQTDFHITIYSTCAIEAPALGKPNILYNIDNLSKSIFENTLVDPVTTTYVNDFKTLNKLISEVEPKNKTEILKAHKAIIKSNYRQNIDLFLQKEGLLDE